MNREGQKAARAAGWKSGGRQAKGARGMGQNRWEMNGQAPAHRGRSGIVCGACFNAAASK